MKAFLAQGFDVPSAQAAYLREHMATALQDYNGISKRKASGSFHSAGTAGRRNRYKDILAYDDTRVHLREPSSTNSDYINANFVHIGSGGYQSSFICSQGPLPHTIEDTWCAHLACL